MDEVVFEGLPDDAVDELRIPDRPLNTEVSIPFVLHNNSLNHFR